MTAKPTAALAAALAVLLITACGSDGDSSDGTPTVTATTGVLADITAEVAGPDASVEQLIPDGTSPHDFQLSARDRADAEESVLLVSNGEALEAGVPVDELDVPAFALTDHVPGKLPFEEAGAHEEEHEAEAAEHAGEEEHGGTDPHVWMDPTRVAAALPALADALGEEDPEHAAAYTRRARAYAAELRELDQEIAATLATIPVEGRELVTSHDALGYFADRYRLAVIATPFPSSGAEAEPSAGRINEVEEAIRSAGVPAVFAEAGDDPEVLELIAKETGVEVEPGLLVESPGDAGSYTEMLRRDAALIAAALGAGARTG